MIITEVSILFISFLFLCLGAYYLGKKKNLSLLRDVGRRGSIISLILLVATIFLTKDIFG